MLSDEKGAGIHLTLAVKRPQYIETPPKSPERERFASVLAADIIEKKGPSHKLWGMYEVDDQENIKCLITASAKGLGNKGRRRLPKRSSDFMFCQSGMSKKAACESALEWSVGKDFWCQGSALQSQNYGKILLRHYVAAREMYLMMEIFIAAVTATDIIYASMNSQHRRSKHWCDAPDETITHGDCVPLARSDSGWMAIFGKVHL